MKIIIPSESRTITYLFSHKMGVVIVIGSLSWLTCDSTLFCLGLSLVVSGLQDISSGFYSPFGTSHM